MTRNNFRRPALPIALGLGLALASANGAAAQSVEAF